MAASSQWSGFTADVLLHKPMRWPQERLKKEVGASQRHRYLDDVESRLGQTIHVKPCQAMSRLAESCLAARPLLD